MAEVRSLAETLEYTVDLDRVERALSRERVIRQVMAESGEPRDVVAEMVDAMRSMGEEAVLDMTDGEPTSLRAGLVRYIEGLDAEVYGVHEVAELRARVSGELGALVEYPWPA